MATVHAVIIPIKKRKDGTWNVKIRVNKDGSSSYIETSHFVNAKQIWKRNQIKDPGILALVEPVLTQYRKKIRELGAKLDTYSAAKLADYLVGKKEIKAEDINVVDFGRKRIEELKKANRLGSAKNMQTVVNSLIDFFRTDLLAILALAGSSPRDLRNGKILPGHTIEKHILSKQYRHYTIL